MNLSWLQLGLTRLQNFKTLAPNSFYTLPPMYTSAYDKILPFTS